VTDTLTFPKNQEFARYVLKRRPRPRTLH